VWVFQPLFFFTVISTICKIGAAVNAIWHVKGTRPLSQKFSSYLGILDVKPIIGFTAFSLVVSLMPYSPGICPLVYGTDKVFPYLLAWTAFSLRYMFLPNILVRFISALTGGLFATVTWGVIGWAFTSSGASSPKYSTIYACFATVFLFFIWLF
jgi:membrane protein